MMIWHTKWNTNHSYYHRQTTKSNNTLRTPKEKEKKINTTLLQKNI